jgi:TolB-like protein/DNA-binding winged helix-turn-helix (wHTH) protein/Flp pilus assembly protein TadD
MDSSAQVYPLQRFAGFEVDVRARELRRKGTRIRVQDQPLEVLLLLLARNGEVVTREELKRRLWPAGTFVDADDGLNTAVRKLREVLGDSADRPLYIETIPRRGYRFIGTMENEAVPVPVPSGPERAAASTAREPEIRGPEIRGRRTWWPWAVAAFALAAVLAISTWVVIRSRRVAPQKEAAISSLAVLPLQNLSGDPSQEYFADGMTEALIGRLSMIRGLRVISRTSAMQFKNTRLSAPEIARALKVDALVEGSVIRKGDRVRVHAQLIRAATDDHFWSETYDREMQDALSLESDVAQSIAQRVEVTLSGEEHARFAAARTVEPEVYESYLKGRRLSASINKADLEESIKYFDAAIQKDATFAPAYVGLAETYGALGTVFIGMPAAETRPKTINAAQKALELDPSLADAHALLADMYQQQWHWSVAEAEYDRALSLSPNHAGAQKNYAGWLLCHGRFDEALQAARRARELDPLGQSGIAIGFILFNARRYDEAIRELRSVIAVQPDLALGYWYLGFALLGKGQTEEAITVLEKTASMTNRNPGSLSILATAYARGGHRNEARRVMNELEHLRGTGYVPAGAFVFPVLELGDREEAFLWLERCAQEQSNLMQFVKVHPFFDSMRGDPRFDAMIRRVGLAE